MLELWKFEVYMTLFMLTADLITQMQKSQRKLQIGECAVRSMPY